MQIQDGMPRPGRMFLSIVVPCCNEEEGLREFHRQMTAAARALCGQRFELILVDDGSTDNTWKLINELSAEDRNVVAVRLARNHGHQLALTAGLSTVRGDLVLVIDADLQDPPELLTPMYEMMVRESADVVYGLRRSRAGETRFKKKSAEAFYRLLASITRVHIPVDTGDFRLMSRRISDQLVQMPEHDRFIRGMVAWLGYKQVAYEYDRNPRYAGTTKYPLAKMIGFALRRADQLLDGAAADRDLCRRAADDRPYPRRHLRGDKLDSLRHRAGMDQPDAAGRDDFLGPASRARADRGICRPHLHSIEEPSAVPDLAHPPARTAAARRGRGPRRSGTGAVR